MVKFNVDGDGAASPADAHGYTFKFPPPTGATAVMFNANPATAEGIPEVSVTTKRAATPADRTAARSDPIEPSGCSNTPS
jgi:hypothetical protein